MSHTDPERTYGAKLEALLDVLEAVPEAERESYLAAHCPDPELRREALAMLAAESTATGYLEQFTQGLVPTQMVTGDLSGRHIGAYRLLHALGQGGMGVVYAAERVDGAFEQRVALKLLTTALTGTEAHRRFLAERRILAGLEHPAIARIIDGGVTDDGTPWFAMERVEGLPVDVYCDHHRLGIRQRLELFLQVCDAVEHAHRRLVVHRDLKPANVLVGNGGRNTEDGGQTKPSERPGGNSEGGRQVKLLDFGIAKLLDPKHTGTAPATRATLRLMTPEYASPEQVRGEEITTASDVYQLGVLLYELLTGHRPYVLRNRDVSNIERIICHQRPVRLSSAITREDTIKSTTFPATGNGQQSVNSTEAVCNTRGLSPSRLRRRLRGDLENIVLKALSKEPERRYGSADRLAQDIRRHLDGRPVTARADTWAYRSRKFIQRHALGAAASAIVLALVTVMTVFHTIRIQNERDAAQVERDRAQTERDRAEAETAKALQINQFVTSLFQSADPRQARGAELSARELLDRGVERVERELAAQPEVQADMLHVLGRTYLELSLYNDAESLLERALRLRQSQNEEVNPEAARTLADLGLLRYRQGEHEQARILLEQAAGMLETHTEQHNISSFTNTLAILGTVYRLFGEYERALALLEHALRVQIQATGESSEHVVIILQSLGGLLTEMGEFEQAEHYHRRALAISERELGADHPRVGNILMNLANARTSRGSYEGVEDMHRRGLAILKRAYGEDHAMVGIALHDMAHFLTVTGRDHDALDILRHALSIYIDAFGPDHPNTAYPHTSLGNVYLNIDRPDNARLHYEHAITVLESATGGGRADGLLFRSLVNLGGLKADSGDDAGADALFERALTLWHLTPGMNQARIVSSLLDLSHRLVAQERCAEAIPLLEKLASTHAVRQNLSDSQAEEVEYLLAICAE